MVSRLVDKPKATHSTNLEIVESLSELGSDHIPAEQGASASQMSPQIRATNQSNRPGLPRAHGVRNRLARLATIFPSIGCEGYQLCSRSGVLRVFVVRSLVQQEDGGKATNTKSSGRVYNDHRIDRIGECTKYCMYHPHCSTEKYRSETALNITSDRAIHNKVVFGTYSRW